MIRNTALCWDSSTLCALAEFLTIRVTAISEIAGESRNRTITQPTPGRSGLPIRKTDSSSRTASIAANEVRETSMLRKKDASTFARKISFTDSGQ